MNDALIVLTPEMMHNYARNIEKMRDYMLFDYEGEPSPISGAHYLQALTFLDAAQQAMRLAALHGEKSE